MSLRYQARMVPGADLRFKPRCTPRTAPAPACRCDSEVVGDEHPSALERIQQRHRSTRWLAAIPPRPQRRVMNSARQTQGLLLRRRRTDSLRSQLPRRRARGQPFGSEKNDYRNQLPPRVWSLKARCASHPPLRFAKRHPRATRDACSFTCQLMRSFSWMASTRKA
jgi:hypothetical protein